MPDKAAKTLFIIYRTQVTHHLHNESQFYLHPLPSIQSSLKDAFLGRPVKDIALNKTQVILLIAKYIVFDNFYTHPVAN